MKFQLSRGVCELAFAAMGITLLLSGVCDAGLLDNVLDKLPSVDNFTNEKPAISTNLKDAVTEVPFLDDFKPSDFAPMTRLRRGSNNGFILDRHGLFEFDARSYCLHAGTYGPGDGDGYLYAPIAGPRADIIRRIAQQTVVHPEIEQHDVQSLIWGILAHAKVSDMSGDLRQAASVLLTEKDIDKLNAGALGTIPDELMDKALSKVSDAMRPIFEAESKLRGMLATGDAKFEDLEKVAVLIGDPEPGEGSRATPSGRWSYHPDGYFVRYLPSGYSQTTMQLYVPEDFTIERDSKDRIIAISDVYGNRIETEYDDRIAPVVMTGDSGVKAYAFRSIRFVSVRYIGPELMKRSEANWDNVGWTLVGSPSGNGTAGAGPGRFAHLAERYTDAWAARGQVLELVKIVDKLTKRKGDSQNSDYAELADIGSYAEALVSALAGSTSGEAEWTTDHVYMAHKAWQSRLCKTLGGNALLIASDGVKVASLSLTGLLAVGSDDPCAPSPKPGKEFDPSSHSATPGNTDRQRLLQSAASSDSGQDDPDRKHMSARLKELQTIYNAFKNTQPNPGEDGEAYYRRVTTILGYDESKGGVAPMWTNSDSCTITVRDELYEKEPAISRISDCAHEKSHQARCRWARDHATGGYTSWMMNANNYRTDEMAAYKAGMDVIQEWLGQNGGN